MNYHVSELYRAIQGEGWHSGLPCTLVRLQGCNLRCEFCDTPYAQDPQGGKYVTLEWIYGKVEEIHRKGDILLITGGEPTWQDLVPLITRFQGLGPIHLETNGTAEALQDVSARVSWVTVSPKPPTACGLGSLLAADEIKWLVRDHSDVEALTDFLRQPVLSFGKTKVISVQPVSDWPLGNVGKAADPHTTQICYEACLTFGWRLSLQLHKYLDVR